MFSGLTSRAPAAATDAVLKPSGSIEDNVKKVQGIEFNDYHGQDISVRELVRGMRDMGFQASAVGDAVRIINDMVWDTAGSLVTGKILTTTRDHGATL